MARRFTAALLFGATVLAYPAELVERQNTTCLVSDNYPAVSISKLPDPFTSASGTKMIHQYKLGDFPPLPDKVEASLSGTTTSVKITVGSKSVTITAAIKAPSTKPGPANITIGGSSIPIPATVGTVGFGNDAFASQASGSSRGQDSFYTLFRASHSAGALTAWAWGVGRIIDGLDQLGADQTGINTKKLGVTGCSRNGKGAFVVGALNDRIALTLP
ncbi:hypothetical protein LQW54_011879 [Pestalotiopsis sp. IQ-011]